MKNYPIGFSLRALEYFTMDETRRMREFTQRQSQHSKQNDIKRLRFPRYFSNTLILPSSEHVEEGEGQSILHDLEVGKGESKATLLYYKRVQNTTRIIISDSTIYVTIYDPAVQKNNLILKIPHPLPNGLKVQHLQTSNDYRIQIPHFKDLALQSHSLHCQNEEIARVVFGELRKLENIQQSNFGAVSLMELNLSAGVKWKDKINGTFSKRIMISIAGGVLTVSKCQLKLSKVGVSLSSDHGEWILILTSENTQMIEIFQFRCRHRNPTEAQKWVGTCLLNGARLVSLAVVQ